MPDLSQRLFWSDRTKELVELIQKITEQFCITDKYVKISRALFYNQCIRVLFLSFWIARADVHIGEEFHVNVIEIRVQGLFLFSQNFTLKQWLDSQ